MTRNCKISNTNIFLDLNLVFSSLSQTRVTVPLALHIKESLELVWRGLDEFPGELVF